MSVTIDNQVGGGRGWKEVFVASSFLSRCPVTDGISIGDQELLMLCGIKDTISFKMDVCTIIYAGLTRDGH